MAKFFDKGTFLSCIKRLKTLAIVASIVSAVLSVALYLIIFSTVQSIIIPQTYHAYSISTTTFASILPGASVIFALVATLCAFGFLTNRAHSDFFHSLPQTREASFVSNIAAVTVTGAMVTVTGALALLVANICTQQFIEINLLQFAHLMLNTVIGVFLTAASVGIAVSITGTRFSNLIVSLIIIYLPQLLLSLTIGTVSGTLPSPLISSKIFAYELIGHNLAAGWLLNGSSLTSLTATIYSLLLGASYTVLGAYLYKRRRSEMAGVSAPSRLMQDIYRTLVGVTMFSIVTSLIFTSAHFSVYGLFIAEDDPLFIILLITMAAISAILYFLYELITTKKWRNMGRAALGLVVVLAICATMYGGMHLVYQAELNYCPAAEDIVSVTFIYDDKTNDAYSFYKPATLSEYFLMDTEQQPISSDELNEAVNASLKITIEYAKMLEDQDYLSIDSDTPYYNVRIQTASGYKERCIIADKESADVLNKHQRQSLQAISSQAAIHELDPLYTEISDFTGLITDKDLKDIEKAAINELNGISIDELVIRENQVSYYDDSLITLYYTPATTQEEANLLYDLLGAYGSSNFTLPITPATLPETYCSSLNAFRCHDETVLQEYAEKSEVYYYNYISMTAVFEGEVIYIDSYDTDVCRELIKAATIADSFDADDNALILSDYSTSKVYAFSLEGLTNAQFEALLEESYYSDYYSEDDGYHYESFNIEEHPTQEQLAMQLTLGMSNDEVIDLLGEPCKVSSGEYYYSLEGGSYETLFLMFESQKLSYVNIYTDSPITDEQTAEKLLYEAAERMLNKNSSIDLVNTSSIVFDTISSANELDAAALLKDIKQNPDSDIGLVSDEYTLFAYYFDGGYYINYTLQDYSY